MVFLVKKEKKPVFLFPRTGNKFRERKKSTFRKELIDLARFSAAHRKKSGNETILSPFFVVDNADWQRMHRFWERVWLLTFKNIGQKWKYCNSSYRRLFVNCFPLQILSFSFIGQKWPLQLCLTALSLPLSIRTCFARDGKKRQSVQTRSPAFKTLFLSRPHNERLKRNKSAAAKETGKRRRESESRWKNQEKCVCTLGHRRLCYKHAGDETVSLFSSCEYE